MKCQEKKTNSKERLKMKIIFIIIIIKLIIQASFSTTDLGRQVTP